MREKVAAGLSPTGDEGRMGRESSRVHRWKNAGRSGQVDVGRFIGERTIYSTRLNAHFIDAAGHEPLRLKGAAHFWCLQRARNQFCSR